MRSSLIPGQLLVRVWPEFGWAYVMKPNVGGLVGSSEVHRVPVEHLSDGSIEIGPFPPLPEDEEKRND